MPKEGSAQHAVNSCFWYILSGVGPWCTVYQHEGSHNANADHVGDSTQQLLLIHILHAEQVFPALSQKVGAACCDYVA